MKFSPKILLGIICIIVSGILLIIYSPIEEQLKEKQAALGKLRGNPTLDTTRNRIQYMQKSAALKAEIKSIQESWILPWYRFFSVFLLSIGVYLIKDIQGFLFKKKHN